jgi:ATP-binding cassette subfamily C protein
MIQIRRQRTLSELQGYIAGLVSQFILAIAKLRVAGAERRAFARWAEQFSIQKQRAAQAETVGNNMAVWNAAFPILVTMAIFAAAISGGSARLPTGAFLAFTAALTQMVFAMVTLGTTCTQVTSVVPLYERARPILRTPPEVDEIRRHPGELAGAITVDHVSFRYRPDERLALDDVSLHIQPGEYVALVGPSGSGKSTVLRLLLGFERPGTGAISYDGQNLATLDVREVRRQLGVVLQNSALMTDDIFHNIIGSSALTIEDAWEAARLVGVAEDIQQMPMGMYTLVSEGGGAFSGGQRQRILLARAIVQKPRILFLDEATSALDNLTQAVVAESLARIQATRVSIAHRLSTIMKADRIYVLVGGAIVQSGTYAELMRQPGVFADLAQRQLV